MNYGEKVVGASKVNKWSDKLLLDSDDASDENTKERATPIPGKTHKQTMNINEAAYDVESKWNTY